MDTTATISTQPRRVTFLKRIAVAMTALTAFALTPALLVTPAHAAPRREVASAANPGTDDAGANGVVNLNTATESELQLLPGVGPSKAAAVVAYRKKYGSFKKVEDLSKVKGFSYKTLKKLKPYLALSGATTYKGKAKKTGAHGDDSAGASASAEP